MSADLAVGLAGLALACLWSAVMVVRTETARGTR